MKEIFGFVTRIIFFVTCLLATIDTNLFVYPSLSRYLLLELGIIILFVIGIFTLAVKKGRIILSFHEIFIILWIFYIVLHGFTTQFVEYYRMYYICSTLFFIIILNTLFRYQLIKKTNIETVFLIIVTIQIFYVIGQWFGLVESNSKFFRITGCNENPTVTALFLTGCIPLIVTRIKMSRHGILYTTLLLLSLACIALLRCRTAYVGVFIELIVYICLSYKYRICNWMLHPWRVTFICMCLLPVFVTVCMTLYNMKKDSADGRLLIWKLSAQMILDKPHGYGYGLFEKNYNLIQVHYFANNNASVAEKQNANFTMMPYNDYLEQGVEGGILGMLFLFLFYVIMIKAAIMQKSIEATMLFCAFTIMSLTNFIYISVLPWLLLMCYSSMVIYEVEKVYSYPIPLLILSVLCIPLGVASLNITRMSLAQMKLKTLSIQDKPASDSQYQDLESQIGTSEAYWMKRAINNYKAKNYEKALQNIHAARQYSSSPMLFLGEFHSLKHLGLIEQSRTYLDTLSLMIPYKHNFKSTK